MRYRKRGDRVVSRGEYRYGGGWLELEQALTAMRAREGTSLSPAVGITTPELLKRIYSVPPDPGQEPGAALEKMIAEDASLPLSDLRHHYIWLEGGEGKTASRKALFLAAHASLIDHLVALFHKAGFTTPLILTDAGACYQSIFDGAEEPAMVVDMGGRQTGIYVVDRQGLVAVHEIAIACEAMKDAVVGYTALSPAEAEVHLWTEGIGNVPDGQMRCLHRLVDEIRKTGNLYSEQHPNRPAARLFLAGRGGKIPGLPERIQEMMDRPILAIPGKTDLEEHYLPAYMLAVSKGRFPNLLSEEGAAMKRQRIVAASFRAGALALVAIMVLLSVYTWNRLLHLDASLRDRLSVLSAKNRLVEPEGYEPPHISNRLKTGVPSSGRRDASFILLLKYLSHGLPPQVYLKSIEFRSIEKTTAGRGGTPGNRGRGSRKAAAVADVRLAGFIVDNESNVQNRMMQVLLNLEKSGFLTKIRIEQGQAATVGGRSSVEFLVLCECTTT